MDAEIIQELLCKNDEMQSTINDMARTIASQATIQRKKGWQAGGT